MTSFTVALNAFTAPTAIFDPIPTFFHTNFSVPSVIVPPTLPNAGTLNHHNVYVHSAPAPISLSNSTSSANGFNSFHKELTLLVDCNALYASGSFLI
jgi:hypothetical protein